MFKVLLSLIKPNYPFISELEVNSGEQSNPSVNHKAYKKLHNVLYTAKSKPRSKTVGTYFFVMFAYLIGFIATALLFSFTPKRVWARIAVSSAT